VGGEVVTDERQRQMLHTGVVTIMLWLEENATTLPSLPDIADADMALMYLRHIERHLSTEAP
jgi:hypothetical protein